MGGKMRQVSVDSVLFAFEGPSFFSPRDGSEPQCHLEIIDTNRTGEILWY